MATPRGEVSIPQQRVSVGMRQGLARTGLLRGRRAAGQRPGSALIAPGGGQRAGVVKPGKPRLSSVAICLLAGASDRRPAGEKTGSREPGNRASSEGIFVRQDAATCTRAW